MTVRSLHEINGTTSMIVHCQWIVNCLTNVKEKLRPVAVQHVGMTQAKGARRQTELLSG